MKKYLLITAILLFVSVLFSQTYTVTYTVVDGLGEDFTYGENCWGVGVGNYTNEYSRIISSSSETWVETYYDDPNGPPPLWVILSFFLTRDETGYTITQMNSGGDLSITMYCGARRGDLPMQD